MGYIFSILFPLFLIHYLQPAIARSFSKRETEKPRDRVSTGRSSRRGVVAARRGAPTHRRRRRRPDASQWFRDAETAQLARNASRWIRRDAWSSLAARTFSAAVSAVVLLVSWTRCAGAFFLGAARGVFNFNFLVECARVYGADGFLDYHECGTQGK